jgi:hypothetical protein
MPERDDVRVGRLILVPAIITLGVTLLRLGGELNGGSGSLFSREAGGKAALVGIVWLIPVLGAYFALRLASAGYRPSSAGKALGFGALAFVLNAVLGIAAFQVVKSPVGQLGVLAVTSWIGIAVARRGWPLLWRVLIAYGLAARIPVLAVMFLSIFRGWDTHYAKPRPDFPPMGPWGLFFWTAILPQLSIWILMTVALGLAFGGLALLVRRPRTMAEPSLSSP